MQGESAAAWAVLGALAIAITAIDLQTRRIPNALNAALLVLGLVASAVTGDPTPVDAVAGAALGGGALLALALAFRRLRGLDGLGLGDVKFLAGAGAWTGWQGIGPVLLVAALTALTVQGARWVAGTRLDRSEAIAFGPYLCVALLLVRAAQQAGPGFAP